MRKTILLAALIAACLLPEAALASNGISEFNSPFEAVVGTITGDVGRYFAIAAMAFCGVAYIFKREEVTAGFKMLLGVVFGISFIAFAASIVDGVFVFTGALV